ALASVSWRAPFVMYSVSILIAVYAYYVLEESHEERDRIGLSYLRKVVEVVPTGKAVSIYVATFGGFTLLFGAILTAMAFLLSNTYGLTSSQVGLLITVSLLITAVVSLQNGRLSLYFSDTQMISMSFIGYGAGLLGAWLAPSPILIGAALVIFGVGHGMFLPSTINAISDLAPAQFRGGVMSLRTTMLHLGQSIGPFSFAFIAATTGYHVLLLVSGGIV
ncbi:MAG: MFS transporter, partial [Halobacteria archaeon]|nr:MFS transporter [Halobacteria archaeon]